MCMHTQNIQVVEKREKESGREKEASTTMDYKITLT